VSAGLAALLNKMDEKSVTIGVDGSVYRFHPYFHKLMVEKTKQLTKSDIKVSERTALSPVGLFVKLYAYAPYHGVLVF